MPVRYNYDYNGMGRYLRTSGELQSAALNFAKDIANVARSTAPVGGRGDKHPGQFRDSIHAETHPTSRGAIGARVVADSNDAIWAEIGRRRSRRYEGSHTLKRAGQAMSARRRSI